MEFWGAEVKVGETIKIDPYDLEAAAIHISQVALGEAKKDKPNESVVIYLKVGEQKLVLGTLTKDKIPQISLDIVLEKEFELSHNSKAASVHFCGYKAYYEDNDDSEEEGETDSEDEDIPLITTEQNGKPEPKAEELKVSEPKKADAKNAAPAKNAATAKHVKVVDPKDEDSDDDDESDDEIGSSDDEMENADSDSEDEDDSDEDDEEETPVKKVMAHCHHDVILFVIIIMVAMVIWDNLVFLF
ncbi:histone deacetylase 2a, putative [Medicago truncatula]|uniref:Histone deacetylase 2a, putative n=1 Tax=Medicago truncatula TaxID=3880 RepID=A0A072VA96_MEDTR|nr:histone deacetylase 2a, putative [Medicago truncatula]